jgi:predicted Zn-dependent protease
MTRDNLLFGIIGVLLGFIIGFMLHGVMSEREAARATSGVAQQGQSLPSNHPPIGGDSSDGSQQTMMQVQEAMKQAREQPNNFDAQFTAAKLEYQIGRYDQAIEYLLAANKVRPDDFEVLGWLGMVNMDANRLEPAEKWYRAALVKQPNNESVLDGLCNVLITAGKAKPAEEMINKLAKASPDNPDLAQFRNRLEQIKSSEK